MSVTAPTIVTEIDCDNYRTEFDANFSDIQDFMNAVEAYLDEKFSGIEEIYFTLKHDGALPAASEDLKIGLIVPIGCQVVRVYGRIAETGVTGASVSVTVEKDGSNLFTATTNSMDWSESEDGAIKTLADEANPVSVSAGDFINVDWAVNSGSGSQFEDLIITLVCKKTWEV